MVETNLKVPVNEQKLLLKGKLLLGKFYKPQYFRDKGIFLKIH